MRRPALAVLLLACTPAFAASPSYKEPWAVIERGDRSEPRREAQIGISKVDGVSPRDPRRVSPVAPGPHVVTVSFSSARGVYNPPTQDVTIDAAPCTRYRIVAQYKSPAGGEWKPHVYSEPLGDCRRKFPSAAK